MTNARRVSTLLLSFLGLYCFVIFLKDWGVAAMASAPGGSSASGFWGHALIVAGAVLALALAAALIPFFRGLIQSARYRKSAERFLRKAEGLPSGDRAIAVVAVPGLERLPAKRGEKAMGSLRLYLEGFVREGEPFGRLSRFAYGLCLTIGDSAAFAQRLEVLKQDAGFLYMAAYPGMRITARVTACREGGQGFQAALSCAMGKSAPEGPDRGLD
jgi:hypothetical protein